MAIGKLVSGVYSCKFNTIKIGDDKETATGIADMDDFQIEATYDEDRWHPYDKEVERVEIFLISAKINLKGKRNTKDVGNNYLAKRYMKSGDEAHIPYVEVELGDGLVGIMEDAVVKVTKCGTGDGATKISLLECEIYSNGNLKATRTTDATGSDEETV